MDKPTNPTAEPGPPGPPDVERRVRLYRGQWIGLPILMLIPILAMTSALGGTRKTLVIDRPGLQAVVDYPTRLRAGQWSEVEVRLRNTSGAALDTVTVAFDPEYFKRFARVSFMPEPAAAPYRVDLDGLGPESTAVVRVEFEGDLAWRNRGRIGVHHAGDSTYIQISTFILP
jgi:hypothetical protein